MLANEEGFDTTKERRPKKINLMLHLEVTSRAWQMTGKQSEVNTVRQVIILPYRANCGPHRYREMQERRSSESLSRSQPDVAGVQSC